MNGEERRRKILHIIAKSEAPVSGQDLAKQLEVSRQVIVQDIALIRANGTDIISTNRGYICRDGNISSRVFKVTHTDEQVEEELSLIVDFGGRIEDVFVYHKIYGIVRATMNVKSRKDISEYMQKLISGKSSLLKNITSGYHYHTVYADSEESLDVIQNELAKKGFLARLQDYEPVDFWKQK